MDFLYQKAPPAALPPQESLPEQKGREENHGFCCCVPSETVIRERTRLKLTSVLPPASFQAAVSRHSDMNGIPPQLTVLTVKPQPLRFLGFQQFLDMKNSWSLIYFDLKHQFFLLP